MTGHPLLRALRQLRGAPALLLLAGVTVGFLADASAVGLLGASGWFIASCAVAGNQPGSTFSYVTPSGVVRALAITRIATRYLQRLLVHAATLKWLVRLRVRLFLDLARAPLPQVAAVQRGAALDQAMRDVDALDGLLASAAAPVLTTAAVGLAGIAVTATLSSYAAIVLGIGVVAVAGFAWRAGSRVPDPAELRASARGRIIAVGEALPELVSLGAADVAAQEAQRRLAGFTAQEATRGLRLAAAGTWAGVLSGVTVLAALGPVRSGGTTDVATVALIALLAAGTLQLVEGFGAAAAAATEATRAARRLRTEEAAPGAREAPAENDLAATELRVPGAHSLDLAVKAGGTLVISGRSGAGKTTLLRQLAGEAVADVVIGGVPTDRLRPGHLVSVAVDDPLIGADVLANLRLGAPQLSEEEARALLDDFGLTDVLLDDTVGAGGARALSGGEQRRLTIARAVAAAPRVLLLDEPTDGLDPDTATRTLRAIREHLPATTVVAAIHDRDLRLVPWADTRLMSLDDRQRKAAPENASRVRPSPQTGQRAV